MKLLSFHDFCALPDGVVYQEYQPIFLGELQVRGAVRHNADGEPVDFIEYGLLAGPNCELTKLELPWGSQKWGIYDYTRQFLVYEEDDLKQIAGWLLNSAEFIEIADEADVVEVEV